jgi:hypothetical protein
MIALNALRATAGHGWWRRRCCAPGACDARGMNCRFCLAEMASGSVAVRSLVPLEIAAAALRWEPAELRTTKRRWRDVGKDRAVTLLASRFIRRRERAAALCLDCGAVVIEPAVSRDVIRRDPAAQARIRAARTRRRRVRVAGSPGVKRGEPAPPG